MEQVLASHSKVFGAGELETFKEAVAEWPRVPNSRRPIRRWPGRCRRIRSGSSENSTPSGSAPLAPEAERIVDKMPLNFMFVGLIHLALPNARIINIRRDPLDTCVSCFSLLFTGSQPFAYDLGELGRYFPRL